MQARLLHTVPGIPMPPVPRLTRGFFPVQMALLKQRAGGRGEMRCLTNITNNLRLVSHVLLRVQINGGQKVSNAAIYPAATRALLVTEAVDEALRVQLERELALMERGENVAANQRRRQMLRRTLEARPAKVIRNFYAVQMHTLATSATPPASEGEGFQSDILHERTETKNRTVYERRTEQVVQTVPGASPAGEREVQRIADQVLKQLDRRMKLRQDRNGIW